MLSNNFIWEPDLPIVKRDKIREFIDAVNELLKPSNGIKKVFEESLEDYVNSGELKRYKRVKCCNNYNYQQFPEKIGVNNLSSNKLVKLDYLKYEIAIKHDSSIEPIDINNIEKKKKKVLQTISDSNDLIKLKKPWEIRIDRITVKPLKTQDNIRINFSFGIDTSKINIQSLNKEECNHKFRLFDTKQSAWEWRLVWECIYCGFLCHCKCFETAIKQYNKEKEVSPTYEKRTKGMDISTLPFYENACEVCRDKPSTHKFCGKGYAKSEFELRYGAYVRKKYFELKAQDVDLPDGVELKRYANNLMREKLGFKKIGKQFVTETELYRIVDSIFADKEVIHHYRDDWLGQQELDIFIPELNLGIEYHGKQHFEPIEAWGGKESLEENKKRDKQKEEKCKKNGIDLVVFTYKEKDKLNEQFVLEKIKPVLN